MRDVIDMLIPSLFVSFSINNSRLLLIFLWLKGLVISSIVWSVESHNILVLTPITTPSHSNIFRPLVNALVDRGNDVVYWNGLKPDNSVYWMAESSNNSLRLLYSLHLDQVNNNHVIGFQDRDSPFRLFFDFPHRMETLCRAVYQDSIFHRLMETSEKFDLIVVDGVLNECVLPLIETLNVPLIYVSCLAPPPWLLTAVGSPLSFESFPNPGLGLTDHMNFWQRTFNSLSGCMSVYFRHWFVLPAIDRVARSMLSAYNWTTKIQEIESRRLSLLITNTHFSMNYHLPISPAVVNAGGLHCCCVKPKPLPQDMESFIDGSGEAGFIIVSFGSILKGTTIPDDVRRIFLSTFARLPQRILWKWENQSYGYDEFIPDNIKLLSWLPQRDLLSHPKIRLFITHGGLLSNQEAVYHGVPFIALPVFADQPVNAQKANDDGYAIRLHWDDLTEPVLYQAIQLILHDPRYTRKMKQVSSLMRDQIDRPLDRAVYWMEYVIRHQGAPQLRSAVRQLSFYQKGLADVVLFTVFCCLALIFGVFVVLRRLHQKVSRKMAVDRMKKLN